MQRNQQTKTAHAGQNSVPADIHRELAKEAKGALVFVRVGDFYEAFEETAKTAAPVLQVALTKRQGVPMCGFPFHAAEKYVGALLKAGHRVALAEGVKIKTHEPAPEAVDLSPEALAAAGTIRRMALPTRARHAGRVAAVMELPPKLFADAAAVGVELKAWRMSYAHDVPEYADFVLMAETEAAAEAIANRMLDDGTLGQVLGSFLALNYDNACNERVFSSGEGEASEDETEGLPVYAARVNAELPAGWNVPPLPLTLPHHTKTLDLLGEVVAALHKLETARANFRRHTGDELDIPTVYDCLRDTGSPNGLKEGGTVADLDAIFNAARVAGKGAQ